MKIYPNHPLYHMLLPKIQRELFAVQNSLRILKLLRVLIDSILFRFRSDKFLIRVLSDTVLFVSSVSSTSSRPSVMDSSLGSSTLFSDMTPLFNKTCHYFLLLKTDVLFYIEFLKRS